MSEDDDDDDNDDKELSTACTGFHWNRVVALSPSQIK